MNMQNLMAQAQRMQKDLEKKQTEINNTLFEGKSGGFKVVLNGKKEIQSLEIDRNIITDSEDLDALEDMIKIAFNEATKQIDETVNKKMGAYANGLNGLF